MELTSAFTNGGPISRRYTCEGQNQSPPLSWTAPPHETKSLFVLCDDPDAPQGIWYHWAIYDLPPTARALAAQYPRQTRDAQQGLNSFGRLGYDGPCPPRGDVPHHYRFMVHALSIAHLPVPENTSCAQIAAAARPYILASATLIGTFQR